VATVEYGEFEWDASKAAQNERKHGVTFPDAMTVFSDPRAIDAPDIFEPNRFVIIGTSQIARILFVVFAERGARRADPDHQRPPSERGPTEEV
jgi:hypothetical protein